MSDIASLRNDVPEKPEDDHSPTTGGVTPDIFLEPRSQEANESILETLPEIRYWLPMDTPVVVPFNVVTPGDEAMTQATSDAIERLRLAACFLSFFLAGYNVGVTGTLLPQIEALYHVNYSVVSMLFVSYCAGYLIAGYATSFALRKIGFGRVMVFAGLLQMIGIIINCSQSASFAVMCVAFLIVGCGYATQLGLCNSYFATLSKPFIRMGILHGVYGFGAFFSPLIATAFRSRHITLNLFYTTSLGLIIPTIALSYFAFVHGAARFDQIPSESIVAVATGSIESPVPPGPMSNLAGAAAIAAVAPNATGKSNLRQVIASTAVWRLSLFLMLYVGAEETIGGWIVSYVLEVRHGSTEGAAWVASGFYLGIAIGRVALPIVNILIGERKVVVIYILIAGALQGVSWGVSGVLGTAISTGLAGLALSTLYTATISTASKLVPRKLHPEAMGIITSVGQSGSAVFPLLVGVVSSKVGIWVVQPSVVALLGATLITWLTVPRIVSRSE